MPVNVLLEKARGETLLTVTARDLFSQIDVKLAEDCVARRSVIDGLHNLSAPRWLLFILPIPKRPGLQHVEGHWFIH